MASERTRGGSLASDEAFAILGDATRVEILRVLGEAEDPMAFSELFDAVEYDDSANFSYHLERLLGHFTRRTDEGYELRHTGQRIVEAIHAGVVTEDPIIDRADIDWSCLYCGSALELSYRDEVAVLHCTDCEGQMRTPRTPTARWEEPPGDIVGYVSLPPAGVYDRDPTSVLETAEIWSVSDIQSAARGVCPRCSAPLTFSTAACESHEADDGPCSACDHRFGVSIHVRCTNCIARTAAPFPTFALGSPALMRFMLDHDIDPIAPHAFHLKAVEESIGSVEPLRAEYTFSVEGDAIRFRIDEETSVTDAIRALPDEHRQMARARRD